MLGSAAQFSLTGSSLPAIDASLADVVSVSPEVFVDEGGAGTITEGGEFDSAAASGSCDAYSGPVSTGDRGSVVISATHFGKSFPVAAVAASSSSGAGGSIGSSGLPPGAAGGGGSDGKGNGIDALGVKRWLAALNASREMEIKGEDAELLQQWGLVKIYTEADYARVRDAAAVKAQVEQLKLEIEAREVEREKLCRRMNSSWHSFFSSSDTLQREKAHLDSLESRIAQLRERLGKNDLLLDNVSGSASELSGIVPVTFLNLLTASGHGTSSVPYRHPPKAGGGMKITAKGVSRLERLSAGIGRLAGVSYQDFARDIDLLDTIVNEKYEGWNDVYDSLLEKGWPDEWVYMDFALAISVMDGDPEDNYRRVFSVNGWMRYRGWRSNDRLIVVPELAVQKGAIEELQESFNNLYRLMIREHHEHHSNDYATSREAAAILGIAGKSHEERYRRFFAIFEALSISGWGRFAHATRMIAACLAQSSGGKEEIVEGFHGLESAMGAAGYYHSAGTGLAAAILYTVPGSVEAKVARFVEASEIMRGYGWHESQDHYPFAAILSLMPGAVQENALLLKRLYGRMSKDGRKNNLIARGLRIMGSAYNDLISTGNASSFASEAYGDGEAPLSARWSGWRLQPWHQRIPSFIGPSYF